jgi:Asp-tRNA(Asn)/Glu-tRNA(Gln) amidotransferase A subunit family amidase
MWDRADADARNGLEDLARELNAREIDLPDDYRSAWPGLRAIMAAEMAHNLGALVDKGGEVSSQFRDLIAEGRKVTANEYLAAVRDARHHAEGMMGIFEQFADAIITLPARGVAPEGIGATGDPVFCTLWTLIGFPALNLPLLENTEGLPIGVQLVGAPGRDERLLRTARAMIGMLA